MVPTSNRRRSSPLLFLLLVSSLLSTLIQNVQAEFNYEVEKRVLERIDDYMNGPRIANSFTARFRANGGFEHDMDARDRDAYLKFGYALMQEFKFDMLYFGLEDGTFLGYGVGWGTYREPANSGYEVTDPSKQHYFKACVDRETGVAQNCTMQTGDKYIRCIRNCGLMKCADEETQVCSAALAAGIEDDSHHNCSSKSNAIKWCRQYATEQVVEEEAGTLGFVPRTYYCHDPRGKFTQLPGRAVKEGFLDDVHSPSVKLGDCEYDNKETKVGRFQVGPYVYCDNKDTGNLSICSGTFDGGYRSRDYDPRYRGWYIQTKEMQLPNWSPPYPFFSNLDLGITYSQPIYTDDEETGRHIFEGVLAVDYTFEDIGNFLVQGYKDSPTMVVVYEEAKPNFIVASSTGRKSASKVLEENEEEPCPDGSASSDNCIVVRDSMKTLQGYPNDDLLVSAYQEQHDHNYPRELLTVKGVSITPDGDSGDDGGDELYIVQSSFYRPGGDLKWIILVISPAGKGSADALTKGDSLFGLICVVAALGFCLCLAMFYSFYRQRNERAVILADWRFTSAFLLGCALLNLSSFTLLGENTDALCMLRMWSFHFLFALALSPLFVKVWRMWRMVGSPNRQPAVVNHTTAAMLSLPIVAIQVLILTIFSIADPPQQEEIIEIEEGIVTQHVVCSQESRAFTIVMTIYEAGLVLIGCVLAYVTRNLDNQFGEAKQLMFSMYNIAFIGIITTIIIYTMDIDNTGQIVLRTIGVFWGTVFSSTSFVLPRLLRVKEEKKIMHTSIMKKSQKGANAAVRGTGSRVRFSLDGVESSVHSEENNPTTESVTENKSYVASKINGNEKSGTKPSTAREKQEIMVMPAKDSRASNKYMGDDSFLFAKGAGWSVYEQSEPTALLGRRSSTGSANEKSGEFNDEGSEQHDKATSSEAELVGSGSTRNMTTIEETDVSISDSSGFERSRVDISPTDSR